MIMKWAGVAAMGGLSAFFLSGCLIVDADVSANSYSEGDRLLGAEVSAMRPEVTITASSNGCTDKPQFDADVRKLGDNRYGVAFERKTEDRCKALVPEGKRMTWSFAELGLPEGASVRVLNSVGR